MDAMICDAGFSQLLSTTIYPLTAYACVLAAIIIAASYMVGQAIRNPKMTLWAKTEIVQLIVSFATVPLILLAVNFFCSISIGSVSDVFGVGNPTSISSIFDSAIYYLQGAALYSKNAMTVARYHLEGYTVLGYLRGFECDYAPIGCWFGYTGTNLQPFGGYAALSAAMGMMFNSTLVSYLTSLSSLMVLIFIYKGFAIFLLPIGIFVRSMPYMRGLGSVLIAVAISFTIIYPFFLAVFNLMSGSLLNAPDYVYGNSDLEKRQVKSFLKEDVFPAHLSGAGLSMGSGYNPNLAKSVYFPNSGQPDLALAFGGTAFVAGFMFPSIALLAAIAAVAYISRLYGEEVDLSRIMQMT